MKYKIFALLICFLLPFGLFYACAKNLPVSPPVNPPPTEEPSAPTEPYTKVVILAGQSNMLGFSRIDLLTKDNIGEDRLRTLGQPMGKVKLINEDLSDYVSVSIGVGGGAEGAFGPEAGIAETLSSCFDEDIYVIKCAFGGTSLYESWQSPSMTEDGSYSYCYKVLNDTIEKGLNLLEGKNPKIVGFCWMQGESDATFEIPAKNYKNNLAKFVKDLCAQYDSVSLNGKMNFIDAYIGSHWEFDYIVNNQKAIFARDTENCFILDTLAPNLVKNGINGLIANEEPSISIAPIDPLHYDSTSMLKLGNMFGEKLVELIKRK